MPLFLCDEGKDKIRERPDVFYLGQTRRSLVLKPRSFPHNSLSPVRDHPRSTGVTIETPGYRIITKNLSAARGPRERSTKSASSGARRANIRDHLLSVTGHSNARPKVVNPISASTLALYL